MTEHHRRLERAYRGARCNAYFAPEIRVDDAACEVRIPVRRDFHHAMDAVHGHVLFKALDDAAYFAANSRVADAYVVTSSFHVHFLEPILDGVIVATGRIVHEAGRQIVAESVARDANGRELARGSGTFVRTRVAPAQ